MSESKKQSTDLSTTPPAKNLAEALSRAQGKIEAPVKNRKVDFTPPGKSRVKYSYADLADVLAAIRAPFAENCLAIYHVMSYTDDMFGLTTTLEHGPSNEKLTTWYPLPDPARGQLRAQEFGSALTYARRYSVSSLVGIASEEDDDGQAAAETTPPKQPQGTRPAAPPSSRPDAKKQATDFIEKNLKKSEPPMNITERDLSFDQNFPEGDVDQTVDNSVEYVDNPPPEEEPKTMLDQLVELAARYEVPNEKMPELIKRFGGRAARAKELNSNEITKVMNGIKLTWPEPKSKKV